MEGSYTYQDHEITEKTLKDPRFAKWFHQQMGYVFQNEHIANGFDPSKCLVL